MISADGSSLLEFDGIGYWCHWERVGWENNKVFSGEREREREMFLWHRRYSLNPAVEARSWGRNLTFKYHNTVDAQWSHNWVSVYKKLAHFLRFLAFLSTFQSGWTVMSLVHTYQGVKFICQPSSLTQHDQEQFINGTLLCRNWAPVSATLYYTYRYSMKTAPQPTGSMPAVDQSFTVV